MGRVGIVAWALLTGAASAAQQERDAAPLGAVALIGGEPITARQLQDELVRQYGREVLEKLIMRKVIERAMKREDVRITEKQIEAEVESDRRGIEYKGKGIRSGLRFKAEIRRRFNMTEAQYRTDIVRTRIFVRKMILRTERAYDEEYQRLWYYKNIKRYTLPERIKVAHILIQHTDPRTGKKRRPDEIIAGLHKLRRKISGNRPVAKLGALGRYARRHSEDEESQRKRGVVGWLPKGLRGEFPDAAWKLAEGEVSQPVRSAIGFHLIQRLEHRPRESERYDTVKERVRADYIGEIVRTESGEWIRKLVERSRIVRRMNEGLTESYTGKRTTSGGRFAPYDADKP